MSFSTASWEPMRLQRRLWNQHDSCHLQLQEKMHGTASWPSTTFVDLSKAFHTVIRGGLWKIMAIFSCPPTFIPIVCQFHDGLSPGRGQKGMLPVPDVIQHDIFGWRLQRLWTWHRHQIQAWQKAVEAQVVSKAKDTVLRDFFFAVDCALNASHEEEMQAAMDSFSSACYKFGLTISTKKTGVWAHYKP